MRVAVGNTHLKDNSNNTFIGLRILNASHNLAFFEFTDDTTDWNWTSTNFCEMYDLNSGARPARTLAQTCGAVRSDQLRCLVADPHQLHNVCGAASAAVKAELHDRLRQEYACKGAGCK